MKKDGTLELQNELLRKEVEQLKTEIKNLKKPVTLNNFLYDMSIGENDDIALLVTIHKTEHTVLLDRRSVKSFQSLYRLHDFKAANT